MSQLNSLLESSAKGWKNMQSDAARLSIKVGKNRTFIKEGLGLQKRFIRTICL